MKKFVALCLLLACLSGCAASGDEVFDAVPEGVVIAVLDTGVSTTAIQSPSLLPGWNYVLDSADTEDRINHGTAVASVILGCESAQVTGLAPEALLVPLVVTDKSVGVKQVPPETLAQAIRDSVDKYHADIINISLGIKKDVPQVRKAVAYAREQGALVISAVGNEGESTQLFYPAAYEGVLAVGSHDKDFKISDFSQNNGTADILAPGEDIWLASRKGKTYGSRGTSYATAYAAAAAAQVWLAYPQLTAEEVYEALLSSVRSQEGLPILDTQAALAWVQER